MLNEKKILVMTKLTRMEQDKEKFHICKFYVSDYVRYSILKTFTKVTLGYGLILVLTALYHIEYLISSAIILDYRKIIIYAVGIYVMLLTVYMIGTILVSAYKYRRAKRYMAKYEKGLMLLQRFYQEEKEYRQGGTPL